MEGLIKLSDVKRFVYFLEKYRNVVKHIRSKPLFVPVKLCYCQKQSYLLTPTFST